MVCLAGLRRPVPVAGAPRGYGRFRSCSWPSMHPESGLPAIWKGQTRHVIKGGALAVMLRPNRLMETSA